MSDRGLHVVFGTGQVGRALGARLTGLGLSVRAISRHRPAGLVNGVDWRAAHASDAEAATQAADGAAVIYQCLNATHTDWPERFPPLQRGVLSAAQRQGALLVSLEKVYGYGPTGGRPMTDDLPLATTTVKGATRAAMTQELLTAAQAVAFALRSDGRRTSSARASPNRRSASACSQRPSPASVPTSPAIRTCCTPTATSPTSPPGWRSWAPTIEQRAQCGTCRARRP